MASEDTKTRPPPLEIPEPKVEGGEVKEEAVKAKPKHPRVKKDPSLQKEKKKRGPARPHRRLTEDVLASRIEKLQKRHEKAKGQLEEAARHLDGYQREKQMRESEKAV